MDSLHDKLFSRGTVTPPPPSSFSINQSQPQSQSQSQPQTASLTSSPTHLDSLFHSIASQQNTTHVNSAPPTPGMAVDDAASNHSPPVSTTPADRQSALLTLLYPAATTTRPLQPSTAPLISNQVQTPPAQSARSGQSPSNNSESQGKILLEQLMG